ncbi:cobalt-precorrin-8 methylmutase [Methanocaldococcus indicus]|uniref:cobalt-precorrin-8 methylmutase n=1 Tax=Methanocaldococcus indicus TaxID=213231 RepID=UPI003C6D812C
MGAISKEGLDIAKKSREIVREKIKNIIDIEKYSKEEISIIERVVHSTADVEYAKLLVFKNNPIKNGVESIKSRVPIVTDINMIKAGIRYDKVFCFINNEDVYKLAKEEEITRASAAMKYAKDLIDGGIVVIGNAPTALFEVVRLVKEENIKPKLIVGVPVGFVQASESKEALRELDVPSISTIGPKGGTSVAVAITNGIIALAKKEEV